ncbi:MAG: response regulator [Proteobacteria bacterium]|nr:response regulator [Pseudomonadota bacterium]MBU1717151.1 response regulator [Pseudomonadota bacterium]
MGKPRILYVDDEIINLTNFEQSFSREYEIFTAISGEEALATLAKSEPMHIVLTDQRMPGISGVDLLSQMRELYPDTIRMILTAFTDTRYMIDSINRGHVYRYIVKPWDEDELRMAIKHAVDLHELNMNNRLLTEELKEKNKSLEKLNQELGKRVEERTRDLNKANGILATTNRELSEKLAQLQAAKEEMATLRNLVPICSYCKKIRDDKDFWQELEMFMLTNSDFKFTHSVCPGCYESLIRPELDEFKKKKLADKKDKSLA